MRRCDREDVISSSSSVDVRTIVEISLGLTFPALSSWMATSLRTIFPDASTLSLGSTKSVAFPQEFQERHAEPGKICFVLAIRKAVADDTSGVKKISRDARLNSLHGVRFSTACLTVSENASDATG